MSRRRGLCQFLSSEYVHFTFSNTIKPLSLSSDFQTDIITWYQTESHNGFWEVRWVLKAGQMMRSGGLCLFPPFAHGSPTLLLCSVITMPCNTEVTMLHQEVGTGLGGVLWWGGQYLAPYGRHNLWYRPPPCLVPVQLCAPLHNNQALCIYRQKAPPCNIWGDLYFPWHLRNRIEIIFV